ncbi:MAG: HlyD family efflux transporter periplasmic adaptor subunit [Bacteroidetes bacterium]|nr:MAG: HlyD family efflux transporter periplasmic adaptor subunit [Bacteroidota bacterium]
MRYKTIFFGAALLLLTACGNDQEAYDASGMFEADEYLISSEVPGKLISLNLKEGQRLEKGTLVGVVDSTQLYLKKKRLEAQIQAVLSRSPDIESQLASFREQLKALERERKRIENLMKAEAATQKQLDDVNTQIAVINKQMASVQSNLNTQTSSIAMESHPLRIQMEELDDQLEKCRLKSPLTGTVLSQYAMENEVVAPGKPIYKLADLSTMILRAYVTGDQLSHLKLNDQVQVRVDEGAKAYRKYQGKITWISAQAEFTPKSIQTKDERANMVYAVKISVKNDGYLKIGMYGEVIW